MTRTHITRGQALALGRFEDAAEEDRPVAVVFEGEGKAVVGVPRGLLSTSGGTLFLSDEITRDACLWITSTVSGFEAFVPLGQVDRLVSIDREFLPAFEQAVRDRDFGLIA